MRHIYKETEIILKIIVSSIKTVQQKGASTTEGQFKIKNPKSKTL